MRALVAQLNAGGDSPAARFASLSYAALGDLAIYGLVVGAPIGALSALAFAAAARLTAARPGRAARNDGED